MKTQDAECSFAPLLISKEYKNRVCPNYDLKLRDLKEKSTGLVQEYQYFTLRNYLQINEESKQDLERLCRLYSTERGTISMTSTGRLQGDTSAIDAVKNVALDQVMTDRARML